jgi:hypothetical protein
MARACRTTWPAQMEVPAPRLTCEPPLARHDEPLAGTVLEGMLESVRQLEPDQARAGSNLSFAASAGTSVGYSPVRQARQRAEAGLLVASTSPSWER